MSALKQELGFRQTYDYVKDHFMIIIFAYLYTYAPHRMTAGRL